VGLSGDRILRGNQSNVMKVAFFPNQDLLVTAGFDQTLRLWSLNPSLTVPRAPSEFGWRLPSTQ